MNQQWVFDRLNWMRQERIWPNGGRYLWTDALGVILLTSLHALTGKAHYLDEAEWVVAQVNRVLGRERGLRIGDAPDRDGQYFHYLAMWFFALAVLGRHIPDYRQEGIERVRQIHEAFVQPGRGVLWKMTEDLRQPYPGYGYGALDAFDGYLSYRMLNEQTLKREIADMRALIDLTEPNLMITQDLGIGMMLWMSHFFPEERWAQSQRARCLILLDHMWVDAGYFCREPGQQEVRFAFTNYGISIGLQAAGSMPERVARLHAYFDTYRSGDRYDRDAITHVMACNAHFPGYLLRTFPATDPDEPNRATSLPAAYRH